VTYTRPPIYISLFDLTAGKEDAGWLQGCSKSFPVHACMVVVEGDSTRTSDSTMLMPRKREAWSHVTTPLIETDSIRCMRQPVPCTTPRLRRGRARGCPPPRSMRRPIHYLCCCWWCLVVVRTRASTHCSRAVCYCATLLVGACCFFFLYCWCCIYYHQNAWISSRNTSRSFRCVWLGQPPCPRASPLVHPILTND
jgi:hypothetical protein